MRHKWRIANGTADIIRTRLYDSASFDPVSGTWQAGGLALSVEIDHHHNTNQPEDPDGNHVSIWVDENVPGSPPMPLATYSPAFNFENGLWHELRSSTAVDGGLASVWVRPEGGAEELMFDGVPFPVMDYAFLSINGWNGALGAEHSVDDLEVELDSCTAFPVPLVGAPSTISLATGGTQQLLVEAGSQAPLNFYMFLGSASGTGPGLAVDGLPLPLNYDAYFESTLLYPNTAPLEQSFGVLPPDGQLVATWTIPPGLGSQLAGVVLHHTYLVIELPVAGGPGRRLHQCAGRARAHRVAALRPNTTERTLSAIAATAPDVGRVSTEVHQRRFEVLDHGVDVLVGEAALDEVGVGALEVAARVLVGAAGDQGQEGALLGGQEAHVDALEERRDTRIVEQAAVEGVGGGAEGGRAAQAVEEGHGSSPGFGELVTPSPRGFAPRAARILRKVQSGRFAGISGRPRPPV